MDFRQIRYFMEVATREHVTEAAHSLHVAQSSVSRQIVNLENELEVDLFIREGRRVHLTPIGKIFFERMCKTQRPRFRCDLPFFIGIFVHVKGMDLLAVHFELINQTSDLTVGRPGVGHD